MKEHETSLFNLNKSDALNGISIPFYKKEITPAEYKVLKEIVVNSNDWDIQTPVSNCTNGFLNSLTLVKNVANAISSLESKGFLRRSLNKYNNVRQIDLSPLLDLIPDFTKERSEQYREHKEHLEEIYGRKLKKIEFAYNPNNPTKYTSKKVRGDSHTRTPYYNKDNNKYKKQSLQDCKKVIHNDNILFQRIKNVNDVYYFKFEERFQEISLDLNKAIEKQSITKVIKVIKDNWVDLFPKVSKNLLFKAIGLLNEKDSIINLYEYVMHSLCNNDIKNDSSFMASCLNRLYRIKIPKIRKYYEKRSIEEYEDLNLTDCKNTLGLNRIAKEYGHKVINWLTGKYATIRDYQIIFKNDFAFNQVNNNYGSALRSHGFELILQS